MTLRTPAFNDAKSYGFEWLRAMLETGLQEGVLNAGDLKVTAAGAGGQRVDIAAGAALVKGDSGIPGTGLTQGLFMVANDALTANAVTLNASDATLPRLDQIVLRVRDSSDLGSGADDALFEVVTGVPTAGATLDNRNGAAALPNDRLRLADVLVPAASAAVSAGNVRDRRPWARGVGTTWTPTGRGLPTNNTYYPLTGSVRVEVSGVGPLVVEGVVSMYASTGTATNGTAIWMARSDAVQMGSNVGHVVTGLSTGKPVRTAAVLAAGSHLIDTQMYYDGVAAGASAVTIGGGPLNVREDLRATADNT